MPNEDHEVLLRGQGDDTTVQATTYEKYCGVIFDFCFYAACVLSGQMIMDFNTEAIGWRGKLCVAELPFALIFFCFNIGVLGFNFYAIFSCPFHACAYVAGPFQTNVFNFTAQTVPGETEQNIDMQKLVFTLSALSGSVSYLIMMYALFTHYSPFHKKCGSIKLWLHNHLIKLSSQYDNERAYPPEMVIETQILNPFPFAEREGTKYFKKAFLHAPQMSCFYFIFFLNVLLFVANVGIGFRILHVENHLPHNIKNPHSKETYIMDVQKRIVNYVGIIAMFGSQYCSIMSCFIFSKVAYAVTIECNALLKKFRSVCNAAEDNDNIRLRKLCITDETFQKLSIMSMQPFRLWFTIHWFFYAVTAFASIAYLVETIISLIYGNLHTTCKVQQQQCVFDILYVFLFTLEHTVLFLYPCFRAASILAARKSLIRRVCRRDINIPGDKIVFIQYMKERKCGFVLSIFCARIEFGFNVAYVSIFLGLLGIVIKFSLF